MKTRLQASRLPFLVQLSLGVLLVIAATLLAFDLLMSPPLSEILLMVGFLSITAVISILAGYAAYRSGWMQRSPTIRWTLLGGYALASLLTFLNVWVTARLMFASQHDLLLATVLLLFAGGIAMALGLFLSNAITDRVQALNQAVQRVSQGDLEARVAAAGRDEIAALAESFNSMATQLQDAARQQQELEALRRDLIAWVSHDLQTPLASIRAMVEALADGVVEDPQVVQRYLNTARRDIGALSALIDDLFQMAQLDAGGLTLNREDSSLTDLISDTLESFSALAAQRQVSLQGQVSPGIDPLFMDVARIGRVLNNLVSNALRHTPPGGSVQLNARPLPSGVEIEISDSGEGIPAEDLPHIFERFYRSEKSRNRATGGAGLGLAIARGIVQAHGGDIQVESRPGQTRFAFILPRRS
ncbi:MAG: ATP-binding protein [Chloroflexota bacterium]